MKNILGGAFSYSVGFSGLVTWESFSVVVSRSSPYVRGVTPVWKPLPLLIFVKRPWVLELPKHILTQTAWYQCFVIKSVII